MATPKFTKYILLRQFELLHSFFAYTDKLEDVVGVVGLESTIGAFNPMAQIEVEPSKTDSKYVHFRFTHTNKYWSRHSAANGVVVAVQNKPEEDKTKATCTLFEPTMTATDGVFLLKHVNSGLPCQMLQQNGGPLRLVVSDKAPEINSEKFSYVDWQTIVKLPKHISLKGDNEKFLTERDGYILQFRGTDPYYVTAGYNVTLMPSGQVRLKSDSVGKFWRRQSDSWIWSDKSEDGSAPNDTLFWPVKIDEKTIALQSAGNGKFLRRLSSGGYTDCLNAGVTTTAKEARMEVVELVQDRKIFNVKYKLDQMRIFDEKPFLAGTGFAKNETDQEMSMSAEISYEEETAYSFTRSVTIAGGVKTTIEASVLKIAGVTVEVSLEVSGTLEWEKTETVKKTVKTSVTVPVPKKSIVYVNYLATKGSFTVPFSYTQRSTSSTTGKATETDEIDGIYTGASSYNFSYEAQKAVPIA